MEEAKKKTPKIKKQTKQQQQNISYLFCKGKEAEDDYQNQTDISDSV